MRNSISPAWTKKKGGRGGTKRGRERGNWTGREQRRRRRRKSRRRGGWGRQRHSYREW